MRRSGKTNREALDELRHAAHIHVDFVAGAKRREALRVGRAAAQLRGEFAKVVLKSARRDDLENPRRRIAGVPKRVPLVAGLENEIAHLPDDDGFAKHRADAAFEHEAVLVLSMMAVQRGGQRLGRKRMLDEREAIAAIFAADQKTGVYAA